MARPPHSSPQTLRLLRALSADPQTWRYGYDLSRETALASGTLYPILMRLQEQGLLEAAWEPSEQTGKPPRHLYRLTGDGQTLADLRLAQAEAKAEASAKARVGAKARRGAPAPIARRA
jgi:DNA-binding PadR family transcriptional regulator